MSIIRRAVAGLLLSAAALAASGAGAAECAKEEKVAHEMSEGTYATVQSAMELLGKQKTAEAIERKPGRAA